MEQRLMQLIASLCLFCFKKLLNCFFSFRNKLQAITRISIISSILVGWLANAAPQGAQFIGNGVTNSDWDLIEIANAAALTKGQTEFTIEFWLYLDSYDSTKATGLFCSEDAAGACNDAWYLHHDRLVVDLGPAISGGAAPTTNPNSSDVLSLSAGSWYHLAYVFDNGTWYFYLDGNAVGTVPDVSNAGSAYAVTPTLGRSNLFLGPYSTVLGYSGSLRLDEFRIWSDIRSASELTNNKDTEIAPDSAGLVGYWKLNETDTSDGSIVLDSQTNGIQYNGRMGTVLLGGLNPVSSAGVVVELPSNNEPAISVDNTSLAYTENDAATQLDHSATLSDADGDADWNGGTLVAQITANAEAGDEISIVDNVVGTINTDGTNLRDNTTVIGTLSASEGTVTNGTPLTITFNSNATNARVQQTLRAILYRNTSDDPGTSNRTVTLTATDNNAGSASDTRTISVTAINDAPSLSATPSNPTFTEGGSAQTLFSSASASTVESGQTLIGLTLTVSNSGISTERLNIDGTSVVLTQGTSGTTATNSLNYNVLVPGSTATITVSGGTLSTAAMQTLVNGISYNNTSPDPSNASRVVTITAISDSGSNSGSNSNTAALTLSSTVSVNSVNSAPSDIGLTNSSMTTSATSAGADVGTLSTSDSDDSSFTYSIVSRGSAANGDCGVGNDTSNGSFQINGNTLETASVLAGGTYKLCIQTSDGDTSFEKSFTVIVTDNTGPTITGVSIPNSAHKVGDTVTVTISVASDSDDYTTGSGRVSGTVAGYILGSLSKVNDTTYTASFIITNGGADVATSSDIAVNLTLSDSAGNDSAAYTTAISQSNDAIYANIPDIDLTASSNTISEDGGSSTLTAALSGSLNNQWPVPITVNLAYTGTATSGSDYTQSNTINITAGNSSGTAIVTGVADTIFDAAVAETIIVDIDSISGGNEGTTNQQIISITDAESSPVVSLTTGSTSVGENGGTTTITASLNHATYADVTVSLGYTGTATAGGADYNAPSSSIVIPAGATTANAVTGIVAVDDSDIEGNETIIIDIGAVSGGGASESGTQQQTVTITDNEAAPVVTLSAASASISESGGSVQLTATLSAVTYENVTVNLAYSGTATSGSDYVGPSSISILAGQTTGSATVTLTDDSLVEASETLIVDISSVSGGTAEESGTQQQTVTITDNEAAPVVTLSAAASSISESGGSVQLTATLSAVTYENVTVNLAYSGTATSGSDYVGPSSISILAGQTTGSATVTLTDDSLVEGSETLIVDISSVSGGTAEESGTQQQTVTITDNEAAPVVTLSAAASSISESGGSVQLTATLSAVTYENVTVNLAYSGTATSGSDYVGPSSISILAGQMTGSATVTLTDDSLVEGSETLIVDISSVSGGTAKESGTQLQTVTITDNEAAPVVTLSAAASSISESGGSVQLTATLSAVTYENVTVNLAYSGTAMSGSDYVGPSSISILAGQTTGSATITLTDDSLVESSETLIVDISSVSGGTAEESGTQQQTVTITDNEAAPVVTLSAASASISESGGSVQLTATLSAVTYENVTVNLAYSGTATSGSDYVGPSSISILAGQTTGSATITLTDDSLVEASETLIVDISSVSGGTAEESGTQQQTVTITDNEAAPVVTLSAAASSISESGGSVQLTATLSAVTYENVTVNLAYSGTATSGSDYVGPSSISILAGDITGAVNLNVVDDSDNEESETIVLDISSVAGGNSSESGTQQQTITIIDNDVTESASVSLSAAPTSIDENGGVSTITASLSNAISESVTIALGFGGSAINEDYQVSANSITIASGQTSASITLTASQDDIVEAEESVVVDIVSVSGSIASEIGAQQASITIVDATEVPLVTLSVSSNSISEADASADITLALDKAANEPVTIGLAFSGTATLGVDYTDLPTSVSIPANQTSTSLAVASKADDEIEGDETIVIEVMSVSGGSAKEDGAQQQTITLVDSAAPINIEADSAQLDEDTSVLIDVLANDSSPNGELVPSSVIIVNEPSNGEVEVNGNTGKVNYIPHADFNGVDSFSYKVSDELGNESEAAAVNLDVVAINDAPVAKDDSRTSSYDVAIDLDVLNNDIDVDGDELKIIGAKVNHGRISFTNSVITYTPKLGFSGVAMVDYTISDGEENSSARVKISFNGVDEELPVVTVPDDIEVNATGLFTKVDLGVALAIDVNGNSIPVSLVDGITFFKPGIHQVAWEAIDSEGRSSTETQEVRVIPLVSLDKDQLVLEGHSATIGVYLNGASPSYPVVIPFSVSGTATAGEDHDLITTSVEIEAGTYAEVSFNLIEDSLIDGDETIVIELDSRLNLGSKHNKIIQIKETNVDPQVSLSATQKAQERFVINKQDGLVSVEAFVEHPDANNQYIFDWSADTALVDEDADDARFSFNPGELETGVYHITVNVIDADDVAYKAIETITLRLDQTSTSLGENDSDGDGVADNLEGLGDSDNDGIPDYLDVINECNVIPELVADTESFLVEGDPGVCLRLGDTALTGESGGVRLQLDTNSDDEAQITGGVFDFIAYGLPIAGQEYRVVIPQAQPIPANAVYRKQTLDGLWQDFVQDSENQLWSVQGESGYCPPPGDELWQQGLHEGHWCVQLVMTDGGPNDADGLVNATIVDPGGVAVVLDSNHLPVAVDDEAQTRFDMPITVDVLSNDHDQDGDSLEIISANASFGEIEIRDNTLHFKPNGHLGVAEIVYGIKDINEGTSSAKLMITILDNQAPEAVTDSLVLSSGESKTLDVLANDTDLENDELTLVSAIADKGKVTVNQDNTLSYTASTDYVGADVITYIIKDQFNAEAEGRVNVMVSKIVEPKEPPRIEASSLSYLLLWMLAILGMRRCYYRN